MKEKNNKQVKKKKKVVLRIFLIVLIILMATGGVFAYKVYQNGWGLQGIIATTLGHDINTLKNLEPITFLLIGESDTMFDTILLCAYNPKSGKASMLSIPRDTYVGSNPDKATSSGKINSQVSYESLVKDVAKVTGVDVTNYLVIDTNALVQLVDAIGGVWYDVPIDMDYDDEGQGLDINLKAGYQKLNGKQSEGLVRFRHNNDGSTYPYEYGVEDHGRSKTQRLFITEALKQTIKVHNIFKIKEFVDIAEQNIKTNMNISILKDYLPYAINIEPENIVSEILPGQDKNVNDNSIWIFVYNKRQTGELVQKMFIDILKDDIEEETEEGISSLKIEILNGSGDSAKLVEVSEKLKANGYRVMRSTEINTTPKTIIINRTDEPVETEEILKGIVGIGESQLGEEIDIEDTGVDFTIVIGKDYK